MREWQSSHIARHPSRALRLRGDADQGFVADRFVALLPRSASSRTGSAGSRGCGKPMGPAATSVGTYRHRFGPGGRPCRSIRPTCSSRPPVANADSLATADGRSRSAVRRAARARPSRTSPAPPEPARQSRQFEISLGLLFPHETRMATPVPTRHPKIWSVSYILYVMAREC